MATTLARPTRRPGCWIALTLSQIFGFYLHCNPSPTSDYSVWVENSRFPRILNWDYDQTRLPQSFHCWTRRVAAKPGGITSKSVSPAHKKGKYLITDNGCEILQLNPSLDIVKVKPRDLEIRRVLLDFEHILCCPHFGLFFLRNVINFRST